MNCSVLHPGKSRWKPKIMQSRRKIWTIRLHDFGELNFFFVLSEIFRGVRFFPVSNKWLSTKTCVVVRGKTFKPHLVPTPSGGPRRDPPADFLISGAKILGGQSASKEAQVWFSSTSGWCQWRWDEWKGRECHVWEKKPGPRIAAVEWSYKLHRICVCWVASRNGFEHGSCSVCFFLVSWTRRALNQRTCQETTVKFGIFVSSLVPCHVNWTWIWCDRWRACWRVWSLADHCCRWCNSTKTRCRMRLMILVTNLAHL